MFAGGKSLLFVGVITVLVHAVVFVFYYLHHKIRGNALGHLHLGTVFLASLMLYNLVQLTAGTPLLLKGDHSVEQIMLALTIGTSAFSIAYISSRTGKRPTTYGADHLTIPESHFGLLFLAGLLLTGTLVLGYGYLIIVRAQGAANYFALDYAGRHLVMRGLGWIGATHSWFRIGVTILSLIFLVRKESRWWLLLPLLILIGSYSALFLAAGNRGVVVSLFLTMAVTFAFVTRRSLPLRFIIPGVVTVWVVSQVIRVARALPLTYLLTPGGWKGVFESLSASSFALGNSEFAALWHNHLVLFPAIDAGTVDLRYGATYFEALIQLLPLAVFPGRPPAPSEWFAMRFFPEVFARGGGFGFSIVAEAYWNFKLLGVVVVALLIGIGLARLDTLRDRRSLGIVGFILYVNLAPTIFLSVRSDFATVLKQALIIVVPVIGLSILMILSSRRENHHFHRSRSRRARSWSRSA